MNAFVDWLRAHPWLVTAGTVGSVAFIVGSLLAVPVVVARIPTDYFARRENPPSAFREHHPVLRVLLLVLKNLLGVLLLAMGLVLILTPGPGVITMLVGAFLIDGPGKRRLELFLLRQRPVRRSLDWLRRRRGKPPLVIWRPGSDPG